MANSSEYTSETAMSLALRQKDMNVVSTLMTKAVLLAALGLFNPTKTNEVYGVGVPGNDTITQGLEHDSIRVGESELIGAYHPLIANIIQHDYKRAAWRDTVASESVAGTAPTFTIAVDANGSISSVTPADGSGYSGAAPTLIAVPAVGTNGHGAVLIPTMSGGTVSAVTVQSGGIGYTTSAVIVVNAGFSEGEQFARPVFHPSQIDTIGLIYDNDVSSAKKLAAARGSDENEALLDLTGDSIVKEVANQAIQIDRDLLSGAPSSETASMWSQQYGLINAIDDGGTQAVYAGVDRSLADGSTYWWRSVVDSTARNWGIDDFVDTFNLEYGLSERSGGVDLVLCHPKLLMKWKKSAVAQQVNANNDDKVREMAQFGFRSEVLRYGNTYAVAHPSLPVKTALAINTNGLLFKFFEGNKFKPSKLYDLRATSGGKRAKKFHVETQYLFAVIPNLMGKATNVS
jgi:hypothetical protein